MESSNERAGEAVCCNENGQATRHITPNGVPMYPTKFSHESCTTTRTTRLVNGVDLPSHTFDSAKALCEGMEPPLRLCRSQEEVDTACNTGCHINAALVWIE